MKIYKLSQCIWYILKKILTILWDQWDLNGFISCTLEHSEDCNIKRVSLRNSLTFLVLSFCDKVIIYPQPLLERERCWGWGLFHLTSIYIFT